MTILLNTVYYFTYFITHVVILFNDNNDINQFGKDNHLTDLLIRDFNKKSIFLTNIKITKVKLNDSRYSLFKPTIQCFNANINEIDNISSNNRKTHKLTDKIKKDLYLDLKYMT